jgi:hypothetical protein
VNARAQAFLSDPRITEGLGVKAGSFELHPGVDGEGGYDSNYFQRSGATQQANEPVVDAWRLRITPSLSFATRGARSAMEGGGAQPAVNLKGNIAATYSALFAAQSVNSSDVSQQSNLSGAAGLGADILPGRTWGGDLAADVNRVLEASNDVTVGNAWRRDTIRGGAGITWSPGGGLFRWRLGYGIAATLFEESSFQSLNNLQHTLMTNGSWKFLPRTALIYRGSLGWVTHPNPTANLGNGQSMDTQVGLNGLISNYFGVLAMGGWAATFYETGPGVPPQNFDSFVGQAQLTWYPTPQPKLLEGSAPVGLSTVAAGYTRNFAPSYAGTYYQRDRGYANMTYFIGERFVLALTGGLSHITRPPIQVVAAAGPQQFNFPGENRVDAQAFLEYRIGPTVGLNTTFRYDAELESIGVPSGAGRDELQFSRYQVYLGLRWFL